MIRIAHCADLQLDGRALTAGTLDLDRETGLNRRLVDTAKCWEAFCAGAIDATVDLVIVAGDLFERPKPTPTEYGALLGPLDRVLDAGMPVVMIPGNHDLPMSAKEADALEPLRGRHDGLMIFSGPEVIRLTLRSGQLLQVAVLPYPRRSAIALQLADLTVPLSQFGQRMIQALEAILDAFRAQLDPTLPSVLVAHPTVTGSAISEAQPQVPVEVPSIGAEAFRGFTYSALGHIHKRQTFSNASPMDDRFPYFAHYPGSMDRRDFGEEAEDKSWDLVTLSPSLKGWTVVSIEPQPLPARSFRTLSPHEVREFAEHPDILQHVLATNPILRVKGQVTPEEAESVLKITGSWGVPVANALEVERETRARDATMTGDLSPERALRAHLEKSGDVQDEIDALLALHQELIEN